MQSPSFNRYSSSTLEDIAARVVAEFPDHLYDDDVYFLDQQQQQKTNNTDKDKDNDKEFEFPSLFDRHVAPIIFPIFGKDLTAARSPLWKLMREERETFTASCSSSETDDLDGVPEETYCVWSPAKSYSAGASKKWKIRDLLFRSNSDGKGNFVFFSPQMGGRGKIS